MRFGVGRPDGRPGARYWSLNVGARRPDVYLSLGPSGEGDFVTASIHESPDHWHVKSGDPEDGNQVVYRWTRPPEIEPGYTKAMEILTHAAIATIGPPSGKAVQWIAPSSESVGLFLNIVIESDGCDRATWPGRADGTRLVARMELPGGGSVCVVCAEIPDDEHEMTVPPPEDGEVLARFARDVEAGTASVVGIAYVEEDGCARIVHLKVTRLRLNHAGSEVPVDAPGKWRA
jgi:hypothetical protein